MVLTDLWNSFVARLLVRPANPQSSRFGRETWRMFGDAAVNPDTATQVAAIWACMDVVASSMSASDWNVYLGYRGEAKKVAAPRERLQYVLNTRYNLEMTAQAGKRAQMLNAVSSGNGYAEIERDGAGRVIALWPLESRRADPQRDLDTGKLFYRFSQEYNGGTVDIDPENLFIIRGPSMNGAIGDNTLSRAVRTVATAIAMDMYADAYFTNHAQLGTVFMYKGPTMDDPAYKRAEESLAKRHKGAKKAWTTGLFTGDWDVKSFGNNMEQAAYADLKNVNVDDICRWFRVPPHKIAHLVRSTNNNIEHQGLEFSRDTMRPWKLEIEQEADYKLLPARGDSKFLEVDVDWAEQGDYKSRLEAYSIGRNMGVFTGNDVARKLGENTFGADGEIRIVQGANVPLEDVGAPYGAATGDGKAGTDQTMRMWLQSIYARVERRKARLSERETQTESTRQATAFAQELIADLPEGVQVRAMRGAKGVINGVEPELAARAVLELKP
jgi:HK97 family phage portal protein